jgi:hypothetical protein
MEIADELGKIHGLLAAGAISEDEFNAIKEKLIRSLTEGTDVHAAPAGAEVPRQVQPEDKPRSSSFKIAAYAIAALVVLALAALAFVFVSKNQSEADAAANARACESFRITEKALPSDGQKSGFGTADEWLREARVLLRQPSVTRQQIATKMRYASKQFSEQAEVATNRKLKAALEEASRAASSVATQLVGNNAQLLSDAQQSMGGARSQASVTCYLLPSND